MVLTFEVEEAAARWAEMLAQVEAGHEVLLARGAEPVARLTRADPVKDRPSIASEIRKGRGAFTPITVDEILSWRDEDRR